MPVGVYVRTPEIRKSLSKNAWRGAPTYSAKHKWVSRTKGKAEKCERCGTNDPTKKYEWSNNSGLYKLDVNDYESLCKSCHNKKDGCDKIYLFSSRYNTPRVNKKCLVCQKKYFVPPCKRNSKYCSKECYFLKRKNGKI